MTVPPPTAAGWSLTAGAVAITPRQPVPLGGFADRAGETTGVLDDLELNLVVLSAPGHGTLTWVGIDALAVKPELRRVVVEAVAAATGCDPDTVVVTASHTHAAPSGWVGQILPSLPAPVDHQLLAELADAIRTMPLRHTEVRLETVTARVDGVGANRARRDGSFDPSARCLLAREPDGTPAALLYDFACHPTVLGPDNHLVSADWVGAARAALRRRLGTTLPVVFAQGCAGDVSTRHHRLGRAPDEVDRLGSLVAEQLLAALVQAAPLTGTEIRLVRDTVTLPSRWAAPVTESMPISAITVGSHRWLTVPGEIVASFGLDLTPGFPDTRLISCADGYAGYFADPAGHAARSYESDASPLTAADTLELIRRVTRLDPTR